MVNRGRSLRSDLEMTSAQTSGRNTGHLSSTVAGHPARHFRQFSTRSRTKSAASFRNMHRSLIHDGSSDFDNHGNPVNFFVKSTSSDALYRKRAISGLNMTTLTRVRSNPGHITRSRSGSMASTHSLGPVTGGSRLKPRRSKSTHSVIDMHEGDELFDNDTTTDEEVEYFTDEDEETCNKGEKSTDDSGHLANGRREGEKGPAISHLSSKESISLAKTASDLITPMEENGSDEGIADQPNDQAPSNLLNSQISENEEQERGSVKNTTDFLAPKPGTADDGSNNALHHDGDDHISNSNLNFCDTENLAANSLKRQNGDYSEISGHELSQLPAQEAVPADDDQEDFTAQRRNSTIEQYIPNMILSQSTGAVRRFEQPPSIQNSLSNDYHANSATDEIRNKDINNERHDTDPDSHNGGMKSVGEMLGYSQPNPRSASSTGNQNNFSTSISSLTNSLLKTAPSGLHSNTRMSHLMRKRTCQNNIRSGPRSTSGPELPSSPLHRENSASVSSINNFAQFLKSDVMDGESRTQRKLWLQRENSIMDLSAHNDGSDSVLMASNIDVKREFERISHEYTNVRRFCNPVEEAISRVDASQNAVGVRNSKNFNSDIVDSLFPDYGARDNKVDQFLPKTQDTKLHRILSSIWKDETALFNKDTNPMSRIRSNGSTHHFLQQNRSSLRSGFGSGSALQHQRTINSLQPSTRAVNRRMENAIHHQQRL